MTKEEFFKEYPNVTVFDFEVFPTYWLLVLIDAEHPEGIFIETIPALIAAYDARSNHIWCGYNSKRYDRFILGALYKGNITKAGLYQLSQSLVHNARDKNHWKYLIPGMISYDVASFAMSKGTPKYSLKQLEGFMGHDIAESDIPWDYPEQFTAEQKQRTRKYCLHDVQETLEVLLRSIADFQTHADLIKAFGLSSNAWSMTKAQLTADILDCSKTRTEIIEENGIPYDVEVDLDFSGEEWDNIILPCVFIQKYTNILDFFMDADNYCNNEKYETTIMGVPHVLGLGGIHGALKRYHQKGEMMHVDVTSFYPSLMLQWNLLTRCTTKPERYKEIYDKRVALKKAGKKREQAPYKLVLNEAFGISGDPYNNGYDPCRNHEVCINGQLLLVMLLERLEGHCELIQSNTDGLIISYHGYDRDKIIDICKQWENDTRVSLAYDEISTLFQKDVNNYLALYANGEYEAKGAFVKFDSDLDRDLAITRAAVRAGLIAGSEDAVRDTIEHCVDLVQFQKLCKLGSTYKYAYLGNELILNHKCFRVYAVKDGQTLYHQKAEGATKEKVANTPPSCCIVYGDLSDPNLTDSTGQPFSLDRLDYQYYIDTALKQYKAMLPDEALI